MVCSVRLAQTSSLVGESAIFKISHKRLIIYEVFMNLITYYLYCIYLLPITASDCSKFFFNIIFIINFKNKNIKFKQQNLNEKRLIVKIEILKCL